MHPTSSPRVIWDLLSLLVLVYDAFSIPFIYGFQAVRLEELLLPVRILVAAFWTLDMFATFFTAIQVDGLVIFNMYPIAKRYMTSWFMLDLLVVICEWFTLAVQAFLVDSDNSMGANV